MPEKVSSQNSILNESRSFIYRVQIKDGHIDLFPRKCAEHHTWQEHRLHVFGYSCRAEDLHSGRSHVSGHFFERGQLFRDYGNTRASIDNEVQGFLDALQVNFTTEEATRSSTEWDFHGLCGQGGVKRWR